MLRVMRTVDEEEKGLISLPSQKPSNRKSAVAELAPPTASLKQSSPTTPLFCRTTGQASEINPFSSSEIEDLFNTLRRKILRFYGMGWKNHPEP